VRRGREHEVIAAFLEFLECLAKPLGLPGIPWNAGVLALPRRFDEFRSGVLGFGCGLGYTSRSYAEHGPLM
jgi:hypothetical protein